MMGKLVKKCHKWSADYHNILSVFLFRLYNLKDHRELGALMQHEGKNGILHVHVFQLLDLEINHNCIRSIKLE